MKSLIRWIFLLLPAAGLAQPSFESIQSAMQLFDKGDYAGVIKVAEKALPQVKTDFGEKSPFYGGMIMFTAFSHYRLYHYKQAEQAFQQYMSIVSQVNGENSNEYLGALNNLAMACRASGKYNDAETYYKKGDIVAARLFGVNDSNYAKNQNNLASLYQELGRYSQAEQLFNKVLSILKVKPGERSVLYATALNNLSTLYNEMGQGQKAKAASLQVLAIRKALLGETHIDYAGALNNHAYILSLLGEYKESEKYFRQAIDVYKRTVGTEHPDHATALNNLADLYKNTGNYAMAEQLLNESMGIRKRIYGDKHPDYALSLNNLGDLYEFYGQYAKAERYLLTADSITTAYYGELHPASVTSKNNLAALYTDMGDYLKAEPLYVKALANRGQLLGKDHPSYALSLNNLGTLYMEIGEFSKAERMFTEAKDIWQRTLGIQHSNVAMVLNNLGALYEAKNELDKAAAFYTQSRDIYKAIFGNEHADLALSLNNLAGVYVKKKDLKKAEALLIQAKDIWKKTLGENNPTYVTSLNNLAALYRRGGFNLPQAEQLYLQAIKLRKTLLGPEHPLTAGTENDLGLLYMNKKNLPAATDLFIRSSSTIRQSLVQTFPVLSEKEKSSFISQDLFINDCNQSLLYLFPEAGKAVINNNVDLLLFFKSLSLFETKGVLRAVNNSRDAELKKAYQQWQDMRSLLAKQMSLPADKRSAELGSMEQEAERLEKELGRRSTEFQKQQGSIQVSMKDIQSQLADDEAVVEFVSFQLYNKKATDSIIYAAYVYRRTDEKASFIPLFEEKQLQRLLDSAGRTATGLAQSFYRGGIASSTATAASFDTRLYDLVWKPLESKLAGIKKIDYSPTGKLYGIAFHALKVDSSLLLMDRYILQQYSSCRDLAWRKTATLLKPGELVLFGSPDFNTDSLELARKKKAGMIAVSASPNRGGAGVWAALPGTEEEVKQIGDLFKKKKITSRTFLHKDASEENLKKTGENGPMVLHIATHGFFLPERKENTESGGNVYNLSGDPLMRSGLVLAGGNYVWSGRAPVEGVEDGIVTAYEISQMNLTHTGLVVLSACETALGDIKGTEGVYGLQRAFKMAGAGKMIVSLWQVPDKETAELMKTFYGYWLEGKTIEDAFQLTQTAMRKKYSPYYWAAFVLIN